MREFLNKAAGFMNKVSDLQELGPLGERKLPLMARQQLTLFRGVDKESGSTVLALKVVNKTPGNYAEEWVVLTVEMIEMMHSAIEEMK